MEKETHRTEKLPDSRCGKVFNERARSRGQVLPLLTSNRKDVLASCRIQAQPTRKKGQEIAGLRTQKDVLVRALCLGCT